MSVMLLAIWLKADSDELKLKFLKLNPCPDPLYFSSYTFSVDTNRNEFSIGILIILFFISLQYSFFVSHCVWYIYSEEAARYSRSTRRMQKMFLFASFSQVAIFLAVFVVPLGIFAFVLTTGYRNQDRTDSDGWALDHLSSLELRFQKRMTCEKSGIQVNIRSLRGQQSDREGANSLRQVKMSETGSHGSHRAPIQNRRKEAGINGSDFNSGGWIEAQSEGETSNNL
ncbi:unnamed protein product [Caenorhabditis nigoni]